MARGEEPGEPHEIGMATARRREPVHEQERPAWRTRPVEVGDETAVVRRHGRFFDADLIEERREPGLGVRPHQGQRQAQRRAQPNEEGDADQRRHDHRAEQPAPACDGRGHETFYSGAGTRPLAPDDERALGGTRGPSVDSNARLSSTEIAPRRSSRAPWQWRDEQR